MLWRRNKRSGKNPFRGVGAGDFLRKSSVRLHKSARETHKSAKEIYISLEEIGKSLGEIPISPSDLPISSRGWSAAQPDSTPNLRWFCVAKG